MPTVIERLKTISSALLITSNPSIELWFLLHYKNQTAHISSEECIKQLCNRNKNRYKKGLIDPKLESKLTQCLQKACARSKQLTLFENPSSNMHLLIEELENAKQN